MSRGGQKMTKMDAIQYIMQVQYTFRGKREKFDKFMDVMKDYKLHRIDVGVVVAKMEEILKDHKDLIMGFNKFLPKGYEILLLPKNEVQLEDALKYVNKIKFRFQNKDHVYESLLNILKRYTNGTPASETCHEVATLFEGHHDLLRDFTNFMPSRGSST